jgi:hypothetical protein
VKVYVAVVSCVQMHVSDVAIVHLDVAIVQSDVVYVAIKECCICCNGEPHQCLYVGTHLDVRALA